MLRVVGAALDTVRGNFMLEIMYDASLISLKADAGFPFFGVGIDQNHNLSLENFSRKHVFGNGEIYLEVLPCLGHIYPNIKRGNLNYGVRGCLEFIVPVIGGVQKYIDKLEKADGIFVEGKFFETVVVIQTQSGQFAESGRFSIPPDHFYFLGAYQP